MPDSSRSPRTRFGVFEVDLRAGEVRKRGLKVKLHGRPFQVLALLLERPGEVVTREELQKKLWAADTFVDFDHGLSNAVNKLREALGDSADNPRFVETLPRHGYRFIAPVEKLDGETRIQPTARSWRTGLVVLALVAVGVYLGWQQFWPQATATDEKLMLAVLPFENLSGDPEQEYFSDGLTEEMISQLGQVPLERLGVIARTSVMHYKNTTKRVDEIGKELGVDYVLEGSVRRASDRVRVTAQLIQVSDQTKVWSDNFESREEDILALQSEVARAIVSGIRLKLTPQQQTRLARTQPVNPAAYEAYLKGRFHLHKATTAEVTKGFEYFQRAIALDPSYALAYTGLAKCYVGGNFMGMRPSESMPKAKAAARTALELDESLAEAHLSLASVMIVYDWDWPGAEKELRRALELDPGNADVLYTYAWYLTYVGRTQEAVVQMKRALELDPLSVNASVGLARMFFYARQYDQAIEQFRRAQELDPNFVWAHFFEGIAYQQKGMHEQGVAKIRKAMELTGDADSKEIAEAMGRAYAEGGYPAALRAMANGWKKRVEKGYGQASSMAMIYAQLGEKEKVFEWLEVAYEDRSRGLASIKVEPQFDPLRSDPRFQSLLRRMNFLE